MDDFYKSHQIRWTPEKVTRLWDYYSTNPAYDAMYFSMHSGRAVLDFVWSHIRLTGRDILDFGCGRGHMLRYLLDAGVRCRGLEFSPDSADATDAAVGGHALFGGVTCVDSLPSPLPGACVDVVFLIEVVEHLFEDQLSSTVQEIYRLLRPGGHVVVTTPHAEDFSANMLHCPECGCTFHRWQHMRSLRVGFMAALMGQAGFTQVVCQPVFFRPTTGRFEDLLGRLRRVYRWVKRDSPETPHLVYIGRKSESASG